MIKNISLSLCRKTESKELKMTNILKEIFDNQRKLNEKIDPEINELRTPEAKRRL